jgi:hypothetical protein
MKHAKTAWKNVNFIVPKYGKKLKSLKSLILVKTKKEEASNMSIKAK